MALLFIDSFDHYQTAQLSAKWTTTTGGLGSGIVAGAGRCSSQALSVGGSGLGVCEKGIPFPANVGILGFAGRIAIQLAAAQGIAYFGSSFGTGVQAYLTRQTDGSLAIMVDNVVLATSAPDLVRDNVWYYIEWKFTCHASAGASVVRVNGATVINLTGANTHSVNVPGTTLTAVGFPSGGNYNLFVDDLYVSDDTGGSPWNDFLGDVRVEYLRPDGPGAHQDWDLIGAPTHWQAVDDAASPDDDLSYIHTATAGLIDTETYQPTGLPSGSVFAVQVNLYARKTDSGARSIAPVLRTAGVDHLGVNQQPSFGGYRYLIQLFMLNPGTGVAWTIGDVNSLEVGIDITV